MKPRLFLDSSVIFAAAYSARGHARDLILKAVSGEITLVTSQLVLTETRRNLAESAPDKLLFLEQVIENIPFEFVRPTRYEVITASHYVERKDAPIVAAAKRAKVDLLVTFDQKHLLGRPELAKFAQVEIVAPKESIERIAQKK